MHSQGIGRHWLYMYLYMTAVSDKFKNGVYNSNAMVDFYGIVCS